ncbi:MAG: ribonuclease P protein component [Lachnospiraceae bacterium]|nr:ribonuclease P protein component [Lachnospiraceae bacterium]
MRFSEPLRKNGDFKEVYGIRRSFADRYLVMYIRRNGTGKNRIGVSVSKKTGNSVVRHRIKRLVKEGYRLNEDRFSSGLDIVVVARNSAADVGYREIESALLHLGGLHGIVL